MSILEQSNYPGEKEVVLCAGLKYRITSIDQTERYKIIKVECRSEQKILERFVKSETMQIIKLFKQEINQYWYVKVEGLYQILSPETCTNIEVGYQKFFINPAQDQISLESEYVVDFQFKELRQHNGQFKGELKRFPDI